jgi:hypothetical protein
MDDMLNVCRTVSKLQLMDEGLEEDVDLAQELFLATFTLAQFLPEATLGLDRKLSRAVIGN